MKRPAIGNHPKMLVLLGLLLASAVAVSLLALAGTTKPAEAAFPGENGKIAFTRSQGDDDIYVMNSNGSGQTRLTDSQGGDRDPAFSPDGTKIAFDSSRDGDTDIYLMNADGTGQTPLTNNSLFVDFDPAFSLNGTKVAFVSNRDGNYEIYVMNAAPESETNQPQRLTFNLATDAQPTFSPVESKIAFRSDRSVDGDTDIYVMNAAPESEINQPQNLTNNNPGVNTDPDFSPDGTKIAFANFGLLSKQKIYQMNAADGSELTRLTPKKGGGDCCPSYSPDGTKVAFARFSRRTGNDIYTINADRSGKTKLTKSKAYDSEPTWGPAPPTP